MQSFQAEMYRKNKKSLDYLIANPFKEPFSFTVLKLLEKNKCFIINKIESVNPEANAFEFKFKKRNMVTDMFIIVKRDFSISISIMNQLKTKSILTNDIQEAIDLLEEFIC